MAMYLFVAYSFLLYLPHGVKVVGLWKGRTMR